MKAILRLGCLALIALAICGPGTDRCRAQQTNYLDMLKDLYAFHSWAGQTKARYERAVTNWVPDFASLGVTNFLRREEGVWTNSHKYSRYSFHPKDQTEVRIDCVIDEQEDTTNAYVAMLQFFSNCAVPQPFPLGSTLGVDVGDRCYLGWGVLTSVFFVRNNVFVILLGDYSVISFAQRFDSELATRSFTGPFLFEAAVSDSTFHVSVATAPAMSYVLEFKDSLVGTNWGASPSFTGDGTIRLVAVPVRPPQQFFRLRVE